MRVSRGTRLAVATALIAGGLIGLVPGTAQAATVAAASVKTTATGGPGSDWSDPSPDPSGITYNSKTGNLIISDGEVEETGGIYTGSVWSDTNLFVASRAGQLRETNLNTTAYSNEPAGVGFRPALSANLPERLFVADDVQYRVFEVDGHGDAYGNTNDTYTSFSVAYADTGSKADPEDVAVNLEPTRNGELLIIDAKANRVFIHGPGNNMKFDGRQQEGGDDQVRVFDLPALGTAGDPEGIAYNRYRNTVLVLDDPSNQLYEYNLQGVLQNTITLPFKMKSGAGIALAPPSDSSSLVCGTSTSVACNAYIVDRGVDNDTSQTTFNDGRLYEISIDGILGSSSGGGTTNAAPVVNAGPDQTLTLPASGPATADLSGTVTDDGQPSGATVTQTWSRTGGTATGAVTFGTATAKQTTASFPTTGTYILQLAASDTALSGSDTMTVTVNPASGPPPTGTTVVEVPIRAGADDAEQKASGTMALASGDLNLTKDGSTTMTVGMRFTGFSIPAGATITTAYVQFQADEAQSVATSLLIRAQVGDALPFTTAKNNITARQVTSAQVAWNNIASWTGGQRTAIQRTPDLTSLLQSAVSGAWASSRGLGLIITSTAVGSERTAESFEGGAKKAPVLHIEYTVP